jgi:hypothetical protein
MHKLFAYIIAFIISSLVSLWGLARKAAAFTNLVPSTSTFTTANMIPGYKDAISRQYLQKVAENTGYNYNQVLNRWYEKNHISEGFTSLQERDYDTGNSWVSAYIFAISAEVTDADPLNQVKIIQLSANYQELFLDNAANDGEGGFDFTIKYLAGGGFRIKNNDGVATSLTCFIHRIRPISGIPV